MRKIIRIKREYDDGWTLAYDDDAEINDPAALVNRDYQPSIEEIADFCDQNAESDNHHDFVGKHRLLAAILFQSVGREQATSILRTIAQHGGLDNAKHKDFGLLDAWHPWQLK